MKIINVFLLGIGAVGLEFIRQVSLFNQENNDFQIKIVGFANSKYYAFLKSGFQNTEIKNIKLILQKSQKLTNNIIDDEDFFRSKNLFVIDATNSANLDQFLLKCAKNDYPLILANKKPLTSDIKIFNNLNKNRIGISATIGAGLPLIDKIRKLQAQNKEIVEIEACLSGSGGILYSRLQKGEIFSQIIRDMSNKSYFEPKISDDILAIDLARKSLIINRLIGGKLNFEDVKFDLPFSPKISDLENDGLIKSLEGFDQILAKKCNNLAKINQNIKIITIINQKKCLIMLKGIDQNSEIGRLQNAQKIALIKTKNDLKTIIVNGYGAGAKFAANDIINDINYIVKNL